jgi:two-component system response regulator AtoC
MTDIIDLRSRATRRAPGTVHVEPIREPSAAMRELHALVRRVAPGTISVLITGETGVGKEVLAQAVHCASRRASRPFLQLNCAALTETLLESELFGHERGSFTGATAAKQGLLETADGGTVFLDEIGELPMSTQVKLLRVLEERVVLPVGGLRPRPIDVRFIAATNRDLEAEIARGAFREDLYFRLNGVSLAIPPLRERVDEIAELAGAFIATAWCMLGRDDAPPVLSGAALALLESYAWPGNIRELRNFVERAVLLCAAGAIGPEHLPTDRIRAHANRRSLQETVKREVELVEKQQILAALDYCAGNQTHAAKLLGISRATLVNRLNAYAIKRPRKPRTMKLQ